MTKRATDIKYNGSHVIIYIMHFYFIIIKNVDSNYDTYRFDSNLKQGNKVGHLHTKCDFDKLNKFD